MCSPLEVVGTRLSDAVVEHAHGLDDLFLDLSATDDLKLRQEVVSHSYQGVFGPALEPVHGTAGDQTRELERATAELLTHLGVKEIEV